jgi:hypothetical protein
MLSVYFRALSGAKYFRSLLSGIDPVACEHSKLLSTYSTEVIRQLTVTGEIDSLNRRISINCMKSGCEGFTTGKIVCMHSDTFFFSSSVIAFLSLPLLVSVTF